MALTIEAAEERPLAIVRVSGSAQVGIHIGFSIVMGGDFVPLDAGLVQVLPQLLNVSGDDDRGELVQHVSIYVLLAGLPAA